MTIDISIKEFLQGSTQAELASLLGVNQSAVSQMLASGRDIYLRKSAGGITAYEIRKIGKPPAA